jgi:Glutamate-1-semialdehyde aminotransferase
MKLDPDIVTLGKIVGGGMAIGIMCGKKEVMEYADTTGKRKSERAYIGGGTFSANPSSMASGYATLNHLKSKKSIYSKINSLGEFTRKEMTKVFDGKVVVTGKGSLFMTHFLKGDITEVTNAGQAAMCDSQMLQKYHF